MSETETPLLLPILTKMLEAIERIEAHQKAQFALLQQQMTTIEAQLNTTTIWASRAYTSNLDPAAKSAALEEAKKTAQEMADKIKQEEDAILSARAALGIGNGGDAVTPQDAEWYRQYGGE